MTARNKPLIPGLSAWPSEREAERERPLDKNPYFGNYRSMEPNDGRAANQPESLDSLLTDAVLAELKKQFREWLPSLLIRSVGRGVGLMAKAKNEPDVIRYAEMFSAMGTEPRLRIMPLLLSAHPQGNAEAQSAVPLWCERLPDTDGRRIPARLGGRPLRRDERGL